jgi:hypothetical protein
MQLNLRKPLVATAVTGGILAVTATAAFAYWSATGSGSGSAATAAESQAMTVRQTSTNTGLVPGGAASTLSGIIENPNTFAVPLTKLTGTVAVDSSHSGCDKSWFTVSLTPPASVPAGGNAAFSGTVRLNDDPATNQDACKGAAVTLSYAAS